MNDTKETPAPSAVPDAGNASGKTGKPQRPYRAFFWGALITSALCFWLGTQRLAIKHPTRADAYFITGILGILSAAMAWSLGAAHERARRSQQSLKDSLDSLQGSMLEMPRSLMEESVRVAAREAESRRADQERQARELRAALEEGIRTGFEPVGPALSARITESLEGLSASLRSDREERAESLRATTEAAAALQAAQADWAASSSAMLTKLREETAALQTDMKARDAAAHEAWERNAAESRAGWEQNTAAARAAWEELAASARRAWEQGAVETAQSLQAALDIQLEKVRSLTETLSGRWEETLRVQRESFAGEWREVLAQSRTQLEEGATALRGAVSEATAAVRTVAADAEQRLSAGSAQAGEWLQTLSAAAGSIGEAVEGIRRGGEETAAQQAAGQAEWRATVEMFHQGMGGLLDRLQALGSYTQGQAALLERMEDVIRSFEERSAELIEDTALKAQESLLDALDQAGARNGADGTRNEA